MVFVDSNVILDVITADPIWQSWSEEQLSRWLDRSPVLINPIVYAEIAYTYRPIPREAAFLAARTHADDRARGGSPQTILADFLIGAHALVERVPLLTRDRRRYLQAFPGLELIAPEVE
jgi:predicted nucleic acid-binding protein